MHKTYSECCIGQKATGRNQEGRDQCGVRERDGTERECDEESVCLLEGILNQCIRSGSIL